MSWKVNKSSRSRNEKSSDKRKLTIIIKGGMSKIIIMKNKDTLERKKKLVFV